MIAVQFPEPRFRIKTENGKRLIFDGIRKTWILLTEEEWVRQNFVQFLIQEMQYPSAQIALEKEIRLFDLKKRFDLVVYNKSHVPWMMVECKAPQVSLNEDVLQQVLRYHISVPVEFLILTNGEATIGWKKEGGALVQIKNLPAW